MNNKNPSIECFKRGHLLTPPIGESNLYRCLRCKNYLVVTNYGKRAKKRGVSQFSQQ